MPSRHLAALPFLLAACAMLGLISTGAQALPAAIDATVASGSVSFASGVSDMTVIQSTQSAIINWSSFSLGAGESLTFSPPSSSSTTLLRFSGSNPVHFGGALTSLGGLFIVAEAGLDLSGASISAPWIWLSGTNISDADFLAGNYSSGSVGSPVGSGSGSSAAIISWSRFSIGSDGGSSGTITVGSGGSAVVNRVIGGDISIISSPLPSIGRVVPIVGGTLTLLDPATFTAGPITLAVPEPGTYAMMLAGLAMLVALARRRPRR